MNQQTTTADTAEAQEAATTIAPLDERITVYTPSYLARLQVLNAFVRDRMAEGYKIIEARLLPTDTKASVKLDRNYLGERMPWIHVTVQIG